MAKAPPNIVKRLDELKALIQNHDHLYYNLDQPEITDFEYDKLYDELLKIEQQYPELIDPLSPSQRITGTPLKSFSKAKHSTPMLSLQNSYNQEDLAAFDERVKKFLDGEQAIEYLCEPKLDGLAVELVYKNGLLKQAITRGDGQVGEDVTTNVKTMRTIPLRLNGSSAPELLEVRGEIVMLKEDFKRLNEYQQEAGQLPFANPRNAAAGSIRQLDAKITARRPLRMYCYAPGKVRGIDFSTQNEFLEKLAELGLPTLWGKKHKKFQLLKICKSADEVLDYYKKLEGLRHDLNYDIDGAVIKVNSMAYQRQLGSIARSPRWASAAKFKPEQGETKVENIIVQVGRTGALTPVAIMAPVKVGGVTITHATLHNQDEIDRKDVRVGDHIVVQRAGDVIPEIVRVNKKKRKANSKKYSIPNHCPSCGGPAEKSAEEVVLRCNNAVCPSRIKESLKHFVSRRAMNIDKLGNKWIEKFVDEKLVRGFSDLYQLKYEQLLNLDRMGEKSARNLIDSINGSRTPTLSRFIYSLGIRFVGEQTARVLATHFGSIDNVMAATEEQLIDIPDVGPKVAHSIVSAFSNPQFAKEVKNLIQSGIDIENPKTKSSDQQKLKNLNIVVTGTLPMGRNEIKEMIVSHGGKSSSSVSKKTNYVLAGEAAGTKLEKAQELGVPVIDWEEFQALIN